MKIKLTLLLLLLTGIIRAQTFTQGDISVNVSYTAAHDSFRCCTDFDIQYVITIQNSFVGDSVKVKVDDVNGPVYLVERNTSGQNPWVINWPFSGNKIVQDNMVQGHIATINEYPLKVISGPDSIASIPNIYSYPVSDLCEVDTVSGKIYLDNNDNCLYDAGDNMFNGGFQIDCYYPGRGTTLYMHGYTSVNYKRAVVASWLQYFTVKLQSPYDFIFPPSSCSPFYYYFFNLPQTNVDFAVQCSNTTDLVVAACRPVRVRPLIPFSMTPRANNIGCLTASGVLELVLDSNVTYNAGASANPADSVSGNRLYWHYSNLNSLVNGYGWNALLGNINLTPTANVNIGDQLCFQISTYVPVSDVDATNNTEHFCMEVVNSFDPNIKEVSPAGETPQGYIPESTTGLTYTIHFQNTGNAPAININVIDTLDSNIDPASLQLIAADHTLEPEWLSPNVIKFKFENINLPDSASNEPQSHGSFIYRVKLKPNLPIGTPVRNTGAIYFDTNPVIYTNTTLNTIGIPTYIQPVSQPVSMQVFPNPSNGVMAVVLNKDLNNYNLRITNSTGQTISSQSNLSGNYQPVEISKMPAGIYVIELQHSGVVYRTKVVKAINHRKQVLKNNTPAFY